MLSFSFDLEKKIYLFIGLLLLFLVTKEAYVLPLTHDEGNTIYCSTTPVWDIVSYKDPVPNNHILNTLCIKCSSAIFGEQLFTDRLHNVLSFIPFFIFSILIGFSILKDSWLRAGWIALVSLQPFVLDFYSITRGYGLSLSFMVVSLYYFYRRISDGNTHYLIKSAVFAAVGVYANFTLINYYIPLILLLTVDTFMSDFKQDKKKCLRNIIWLFIISTIIAFISSVPIYKMVTTKQFVYWGSTGFFQDTARHLILSLRSGTEYIGATSDQVYISVLTFIVLVITCGLLLWKKSTSQKIFVYSIGMLITVMMYNVLQQYVGGVPFLNARTALFFVPLVSICVMLSVQNIYNFRKSIGLPMAMVITMLCCQHFVRGYDVKSSFEWYYDQNTYDVLNDLKEIAENEHHINPAKVNCYWIFYPSISYHTEKDYQRYLELAPYGVKIEDDNESLFYYAQSDEVEKLSEKFEVIRRYADGARVLMRAKGR